MWLVLAFLSAALLGFYDAFKKKALSGNAVIPVLFLNTLFSSLIFLPFIMMSYTGNSLDGTMFHVAEGGWEVHKYIVLKSFIVLSSWIFGYFGMKHLPLTIVGRYQRHPSGDDTRGCPAGLRRGTQPLPVDWCHPCHHLLSPCFRAAERRRASTSSTTSGFTSSYWLPFSVP